MSFFTPFLNRAIVPVLILIINSFLMGYSISFPSTTISDITAFFEFSTSESGLFSAVASLTAVLAPLYCRIFNRDGSRRTVQMISLLSLMSWAILLLAPKSSAVLPICHRVLLGVSMGSVSAIVPGYIIEITPEEFRNVYGTLHQFGITLGIFMVNFMGMFYSWRSLALISLVISGLAMCLMKKVPESPSSSMALGEPKIGMNNSIFSKEYRKGLVIGTLMMVFQQFSGINAVLSNLGSIIQSKFGPSLASSAQCFSCLICISVIDRIGRKKTWMISLFGSAFALLILSLSISFGMNSFISIVSLFAFLFFFGFGLGPIPWSLPPEFFPDSVRKTGLSILSSLNWIFSFVVIFVYSILTELFSETFTFVVFSIILICGGFFGIFVLSEKNITTDISNDVDFLEEEQFSFNELSD